MWLCGWSAHQCHPCRPHLGTPRGRGQGKRSSLPVTQGCLYSLHPSPFLTSPPSRLLPLPRGPLHLLRMPPSPSTQQPPGGSSFSGWGALSLALQQTSCLRLIEFSAWEGSGELRAEQAGKNLLTGPLPSLKPCSIPPPLDNPPLVEWGWSDGEGAWEKWSSSWGAAPLQ